MTAAPADADTSAAIYPRGPRSCYASFLKRCLDFLVSLLLIIFLLPLMAVVALAVRLILGPPVFFLDERAGIHGNPIWIVKFRSMREAATTDGQSLPDADRLTFFGRLLRQTSLDELPQLFSVLRGDMSMVGPRPLPLRYIPRYNSRQATRLLVHPGLTGWAQIHGRNAVNWPERLELDVRYVEMLGGRTALLTDLWIGMVTAVQVVATALTGRGVSAQGAATMKEFEA